MRLSVVAHLYEVPVTDHSMTSRGAGAVDEHRASSINAAPS